jgi:lysozyme
MPNLVTSIAKHPATWVTVAITIVGGFEGFSSKPYVDTVGTGHPETWCYGETAADGPPPPYSKVFTKEECQTALGKDLLKYDAYIQKCTKPEVYAALPPHRHAALVSFVYNLGPGAYCNGSVSKDLNKGDVTGACVAMLAYDHANGRVLAGLTRRRQEEEALCMMED